MHASAEGRVVRSSMLWFNEYFHEKDSEWKCVTGPDPDAGVPELCFPIIVSVWVGDNFTGGQQRFRRIYFKLYSSHSITTEIEDKSCIAQNASVK